MVRSRPPTWTWGLRSSEEEESDDNGDGGIFTMRCCISPPPLFRIEYSRIGTGTDVDCFSIEISPPVCSSTSSFLYSAMRKGAESSCADTHHRQCLCP